MKSLRAILLGLPLLICGCTTRAIFSPQEGCVRFVVGSCISNRDDALWDEIAAVQPDGVLLTGDTVYHTPESMRSPTKAMALFESVYGSPSFTSLRSKVPVIAAIDDHDFGEDNSERSNPWRDVTIEAFRLFWTPLATGVQGPAPLSSLHRIGGVDILVVDGRSFRQSNPPELFGEAQWRWIEGHLIKETSDPIVLVSGTPFLVSDSSRESLRQFPVDRDLFITLLRRAKRPIVLVSGDAHFGEINMIKIGERTIGEISASPLAAPVRESNKVAPNSYRVAGPLRSKLFGVVDICLSGKRAHYKGSLHSRETGEVVSSGWSDSE